MGGADKSRRGFVRVSRRHPERKQIEALDVAKAGEIYVDGRGGENISALTSSLRKGDTVLATSLGRLGKTITAVRDALDVIHEKKAVFVETSTGRRSDRVQDVIRMMADAELELRLERRTLTRRQAKRLGALGNQKLAEAREWFPTPDDIAKALVIWKNVTTYPRTVDALAAMDERWSAKTAYRKLGRRWPNLPLGRPKGK